MRKVVLQIICCLLALNVQAQKNIELFSPDGNIKLALNISDEISYTISCEDVILLENNRLQLELNNEVLGEHPHLQGQRKWNVKEMLNPVVPLKFSTIENEYSQLLLDFKGGYSLEFRAFNDGIAYRFIMKKRGNIEIMNEVMQLNFPSECQLHLQQTGGFKTAYEEPYLHLKSGDVRLESTMATLPLLLSYPQKYSILLGETEVFDYPCMFVKGGEKNCVRAVFPKVPIQFEEDGDRSMKILEEAAYIARTTGKREFPWRYFVIAKEDKQLVENTMSCRLSSGCSLLETSWIKPGQASWEWWNDAAPYGPDVNFVSGYNLETYKYYIDFASKYGIRYIIMDEGWAKSTRDPYTPNAKVDVHELIRYAEKKNVGIVLWLTWLTVENNMDLFKTFSEWGVKGVKIDFMDRSDQWMMNFYERVAAEAAKYKLFVDFHGSVSPKGLEYKYPNVLSYEGVRGMEQMGGATPDNSIFMPFMRNAVGAMDYTPGAMLSMQPNVYCSQRPNSASIGTRAYQLALFVIFESGLQMLADNPTLYYRNADCTEFITRVPVTWDETKVLDARIGEYLIVAKRKGEKWFIGGMTNNRNSERIFEISLDFLNEDRGYKMVAFEDGINANRQAMDYKRYERSVNKKDKIVIRLARNGGFAALIE